MKTCLFQYGNYQYTYCHIDEERKTLSLTVHPDLRIVLKSPFGASPERREAFLKRKWVWLETQLRFFKKYRSKIFRKEFVSGESFWYLGRQYRLKVYSTKQDRVLLTKGNLLLYTTKNTHDGEYNQKILKHWYKRRSQIIFAKRYQIVLTRFHTPVFPQLVIRQMAKRWGSFVNHSKIVLNPRLIEASTDCIDYVITHELCHMKYKSHNQYFYRLLNQKCPNWEQIKEKLEIKFG